MRKKFIIIITAIIIGASSLATVVFAYSFIGVEAYDYIKQVSEDPARFRYRNTLSITRLDVMNNRVFVLFDAEYLLKMDERKQFFGEVGTNGVSQLILGWTDDTYLMDRESPEMLRYRESGQEYYSRHTLFRERIYMNDDFQIPDMVEVELPANYLHESLTNNWTGRLYYYIEAFGFYTDGFIDYRSCREDFHWASGECVLSIDEYGKLDYVPWWRFNFIEAGGSLDWLFKPELEPEQEEETIFEPGVEPEIEPEPELELEVELTEDPGVDAEAEPDPGMSPEPVSSPEPVLKLGVAKMEIYEVEKPEPEAVEPVVEEIEPEAEPEPEPETVEIEPEITETEPETVEIGLEPKEIEPKTGESLLEVVAVASVPIRGDGGEKSGAVVETANAVKVVPRTITVPNTGYEKHETRWEFLIFPVAGAVILAFWWFWPYKKAKNVKKSRKKLLTFSLSRDKMVTV